MKNIIILLFVFSVACNNQATEKVSDPNALKHLNELVDTQNYFKLKEDFVTHKNKLTKGHALYYEAIVLNVFNNSSESNTVIHELLKLKTSELTDTMLNKLYNIKLLNHINQYEYNEAASASEYIQKNYGQINDSSEVATLENEIKIWKSLKNTPKQEIIRNSDISFPLVKDKVGLFNIDVSINKETKNFVFDTGANFSVIKRSLVEEFRLTYIDSDFYVTAFTGKKIDSDIAIADELTIGGIIYKNVVFLVLNDADISFPQLDYSINGIIGFPVIEAMDEIRISKNNTVFIPENPIDYNQNNFALDGLRPIIAVKYKKDRLCFGFDTGARESTLYAPFYEKYRNEIEDNYEVETFKSSSAGGVLEFEGYIVKNISLSVAESNASLKNLQLHKDNIGKSGNNFHGNFGQDYIKQFDEMIISFKHSSVIFN